MSDLVHALSLFGAACSSCQWRNAAQWCTLGSDHFVRKKWTKTHGGGPASFHFVCLCPSSQSFVTALPLPSHISGDPSPVPGFFLTSEVSSHKVVLVRRENLLRIRKMLLKNTVSFLRVVDCLGIPLPCQRVWQPLPLSLQKSQVLLFLNHLGW